MAERGSFGAPHDDGVPNVLVRTMRPNEEIVSIPTVRHLANNDHISPRSHGSRSLESSFAVTILLLFV